ncbi:hypothetical protein CONPUDRAFT_144981 [Coniophora puteana RWD-64-598 SS2]|uniref:F-box domain-containing protein n=1 Tax=Coniophora puteana (strain RWD-64-598) TaxID=741705 RepID=A0A5M3MMM5_CONPW|nr:uncharacterized protein CONPUDRAFT_144981 [Coniophora puteana RWD-64-598 SS2]EIW79851.1 hypothetical protein CONPUDRAFT_144981 [Coniophora puteana RWD-64-598 SS2]
MHSCFQVPELISMICSFLSGPKDSATLVALASTCKILRDPALDALWHDLRSLAHLVMCLPEDLWTTVEREVEGAMVADDGNAATYQILHFQRAMTPSDWRILEQYARRVRKLEIAGSGHVYVEAETLAAISVYCGFSCDELPEILSEAAKGFHKLKALEIMLPYSDTTSTTSVLSTLGTLRSLKNLTLRIQTSQDHHQDLLSGTSLYLSGFTRLHLFGYPGFVGDVLSCFDLTSITTFGSGFYGPVKVSDSDDEADIGEMDTERHDIRAVLTSCAVRLPEALRRIELHFFEGTSLPNSDLGLALQPFSRFHGLTELALGAQTACLTDNQLGALSFPNLRWLHCQWYGQPPKATLRSIGLLQLGCPRLQQLHMPLNLRVTNNTLCDTSPVDICTGALAILDLTGSLLDDPEFAARHIAAMVLNLSFIHFNHADQAMAERWVKRVAAAYGFWKRTLARYQLGVKNKVGSGTEINMRKNATNYIIPKYHEFSAGQDWLSKKTLSSLARTCKDLKEPALDAIYYEVNLVEAVMCLPRDAWTTEQRQTSICMNSLEEKQETSLKRRFVSSVRSCLVTGTSWKSTPIVYEVYIYMVSSSSGTRLADAVAPEFLGAISVYCGPTLFPQLRKLWFYGDQHGQIDRAFSSFPRLLLEPRLGNLEIHNLNQNSLHVLKVLYETNQKLQSLSMIEVFVDNIMLPVFLLQVAENMKNLKALTFSLPHVGVSTRAELLYTIGQFKSLRSLDLLSPARGITQPHDFTVSSAISLPNLSHIGLRARNWALLMNCFDIKTIQSFSVTAYDPPDGNGNLVFTTLGNRFPGSTRDIRISLSGCTKLDIAALQMLVKFRDLTILDVNLKNTTFVLANDDLRLLAMAVPHLLRLGFRLFPQDPRVTLRGIGLLLQSCTKLKHIDLAVDLKVANNVSIDILPVNVCSMTLISWNVRGSLIDDPEFAALQLSAMMPYLTEIRDWDNRQAWKKVESLLAFFRGAFWRHQQAIQSSAS